MDGRVESALVDHAHLHDLREMLGKESINRLIVMFLDELTVAPTMIAGLLATQDLGLARSAAHRLQGAALNLGCVRIAQISGRIATDQHATPADRAPQLLRAADETGACLRQIVG